MNFVVGIDPSLIRTGITVLGCDDGAARLKVIRDTGYSLPETASYDDRSDRIVSQAQTIAKILDKLPQPPDIVLIEAPIFPKHVLPSYFDRAGLWIGVYSAIKARRLPRAVVSPTTLKKWAVGTGRADKELVLAEVRKWWPEISIPNHDIADSAVLAAMAGTRLGWSMPFDRRRRHIEGLVTVNWPKTLEPFTLTARVAEAG